MNCSFANNHFQKTRQLARGEGKQNLHTVVTNIILYTCIYTNIYCATLYPPWKGSRRGRATCDEIVYSHELCICTLLARPWHTILCSRHARHDEQDQCSRTTRTSQYISPCLCGASIGQCNTQHREFNVSNPEVHM